jgi:IS605 OrfB family transposase
MNDDKTITAFVPFEQDVEDKMVKNIVGIDINERSVDVAVVKHDCIDFTSIDTGKISTTHYTYSLKRKTIATNFDENERHRASKRKELLGKHGKIERDVTKNELHDLANQVRDIVIENKAVLVMEDLTNIRQSSSRERNLASWQETKPKQLRRRLNRWNFKQFQSYVDYKVKSAGYPIELVDPRNTSKTCIKCGKKTKCFSEIFTCKHCGFTMNRHLHATMNIVSKYLDNQDVASADPAEGFQMNVTSGEFRELVEAVAGGINQANESYPLLST